MSKHNRKALKERYKPGGKLSVEDLWDLVDSTVNIVEDGFSKQPETGIALTPTGGNSSVLSVFREAGDDLPAWQMAIDRETGDLQIGTAGTEGFTPVIVLKQNGTLELGRASTKVAVPGSLETPGRKDSFLCGACPADGRWHDITGELEGCWALEIFAGCGRKESRKYAFIAATAVHCSGTRRRIAKTSSHRGFGSRICLKWVKKRAACRLYIKTRFKYRNEASIRYNISKLWDSPFME